MVRRFSKKTWCLLTDVIKAFFSLRDLIGFKQGDSTITSWKLAKHLKNRTKDNYTKTLVNVMNSYILVLHFLSRKFVSTVSIVCFRPFGSWKKYIMERLLAYYFQRPGLISGNTIPKPSDAIYRCSYFHRIRIV